MKSPNERRAASAALALRAFPDKEKGEHVQNIRDLISDLGHLLRKHHLSCEEVVEQMEMSIRRFEEECK